MIVKRGDVDATLKQLCHNRLNLSVGQHKIAHDYRTAGCGLKAKPTAERERRLDSYAVNSHMEVAARNAIAVDIALH